MRYSRLFPAGIPHPRVGHARVPQPFATSRPKPGVRLACIRHAASVDPEPGSNSSHGGWSAATDQARKGHASLVSWSGAAPSGDKKSRARSSPLDAGPLDRSAALGGDTAAAIPQRISSIPQLRCPVKRQQALQQGKCKVRCPTAAAPCVVQTRDPTRTQIPAGLWPDCSTHAAPRGPPPCYSKLPGPVAHTHVVVASHLPAT